jgi:tRNA A58 N-methylase Trm61
MGFSAHFPSINRERILLGAGYTFRTLIEVRRKRGGMSGVVRYLGRLLGFSQPERAAATGANNIFKNASPRDLTRFAEGDRVLVDRTKLTFQITRNAKFGLSKGELQFNDIIGKPSTSTYVRSSKGSLHKVEFPSLEDYVTLTPRLVTPVYSSYASTIVSLLDIHPEPYAQGHATSPRLEILEAGTGHGSLTLHLARAIAVANPPLPTAELPKPRAPKRPFLQEKQDANPDALTQAWSQWKADRRAVIHTVEAVPANSIHAEKVVRGFRRGLYWPHVDFYTSDVKIWLEQHPRNDAGEAEYLNFALLDMPGVHEQLKHVAPAMRDEAKLVVFVPSVTQIGDCVRSITDEGLPFEMSKVLELGEGISSGRKWDVRFVKPRKGSLSGRPEDGKKNGTAVEPSQVVDIDKENNSDTPSEDILEDEVERLAAATPATQDQTPVMICRPMVGERTFGGGFIALFNKVSPASASLHAEWRLGQTGRAKKRNR